MEKLKYIFLLVPIIMACESDFTLKNPLPPSLEALDYIPDNYIGRYICHSDSSIIYISEKAITVETKSVFESSINNIQETENCSIVDGGLYFPGKKECIPFEYISEDSIRAIVWDLDTLIDLSSKLDVIKHYEKVMYVNKSNEQDHWLCWTVEHFDNGILKVAILDIPTSRDSIELIAESYETVLMSNGKSKFILNPDFAEFKSMIDMKLFNEFEVLEPINLEFQKTIKQAGKGDKN